MVQRGVNDHTVVDLVRHFRHTGVTVRFIEYMDVGGATSWAMGKVFSRSEILARLEAYYGSLQVDGAQGAAPAQCLRAAGDLDRPAAAPRAGAAPPSSPPLSSSPFPVAAPPSQLIHVIDVATWTEVNAFRAPGLRVHGLAWADDGTLWVADTSAGTISRLDAETGRVWEVIRVEAPVEIHGLTIHQGVLWYCDAATCGIGQLYLD